MEFSWQPARTLRIVPESLGTSIQRFFNAQDVRLLQGNPAGGVQLTAIAEVIAAGQCPVRGEELTGASLRCRVCRTPHHPDRWTYNGKCAVYGCGGRSGTRVRIERPGARRRESHS